MSKEGHTSAHHMSLHTRLVRGEENGEEVYHLSKSIAADQVCRALAPYVRGFVRIGVHG